MVELIITGHGKFSQGLYQALAMIAGEQEHINHLNFEDGMPLEDFQAGLTELIQKALDRGNQVVIFTDLKGGTPFNIAMLLAESMNQVEVIYGTNLPMLIECGLTSTFTESASDLADSAVKMKEESIGVGSLTGTDSDDNSSLDGI